MVAATLLVGCSSVQTVAHDLTTISDAQTAVGKTADAVVAVGASGSSLLSKVQAASCAGQAIANTVTDMLAKTGHTGAAANSAQVSTDLGFGCTWTLPVLPAKAAS